MIPLDLSYLKLSNHSVTSGILAMVSLVFHIIITNWRSVYAPSNTSEQIIQLPGRQTAGSLELFNLNSWGDKHNIVCVFTSVSPCGGDGFGGDWSVADKLITPAFVVLLLFCFRTNNGSSLHHRFSPTRPALKSLFKQTVFDFYACLETFRCVVSAQLQRIWCPTCGAEQVTGPYVRNDGAQRTLANWFSASDEERARSPESELTDSDHLLRAGGGEGAECQQEQDITRCFISADTRADTRRHPNTSLRLQRQIHKVSTVHAGTQGCRPSK